MGVKRNHPVKIINLHLLLWVERGIYPAFGFDIHKSGFDLIFV
jgi:hypothetical protein